MRFLLLLALLPLYSSAADFQHRNMVAGAAFASAVDRPLGNTIWFSSFSIEGKNAAGFLNSSNMPLLTVANTAISAYDAHITYDISNFYKKDDGRLKIVSNAILQSPNTIYSIGFDTGVSTAKISIKPSIFLGVTHVFSINKNSYFLVGGGAWFGGKVSETACYDSYDRAYWCQNLTAWSDYQPSYPQNFEYLDIKYIYRF